MQAQTAPTTRKVFPLSSLGRWQPLTGGCLAVCSFGVYPRTYFTHHAMNVWNLLFGNMVVLGGFKGRVDL